MNVRIVCLLLFVLSSLLRAGETKTSSIVFTRLTGGYWQVWAMAADGQKARQITTEASDKRYPVWLNDKALLCRNNDNRALQVDLKTGKTQRILTNYDRVGRVVPSPDGKRLLFVRFRTELLDSSNLWVTDLDGSNPRVLTREVGLQYDPAWSPDGSKIAYVSGHGFGTHELCIMDDDGQNRQQLTKNRALELLPAFSPDGKKIAFVSDRSGDYEIWLMKIDGTEPKQITDSPGLDTRPCWTPDGERILFTSNRTSVLQIWTMNKQGGDLQQLTSGAPSQDPQWRNIQP